MNLPNYFLADLPPEATLTPPMIAEACQTLKRNRGQYLAARSTSHLVKVISETSANWLQPDYPFRCLVLEVGPSVTGFQHATLVRGGGWQERQQTPLRGRTGRRNSAGSTRSPVEVLCPWIWPVDEAVASRRHAPHPGSSAGTQRVHQRLALRSHAPLRVCWRERLRPSQAPGFVRRGRLRFVLQGKRRSLRRQATTGSVGSCHHPSAC